ncbi:DNA (cytosine-5-)-methyltransferase [Clostridium algidicarnis]|uniref:Cytosine-specific methyltransferase n=1 Tax=Clostridium algidicarnis TaxID=37659 RepID=A0ABS6C266_9CLOT|nr:DNA (cytosine-5-)-methyltransferase [Clostridium algidicarnis]MBB6698361.1 DNA (cytosine-5-)-methyltransferase [Clostridium algidicarnis]MBU3219582.1 DNA (cytosine-5-)-methyltransferase [Clostridium algidicarnis]
MLKVVESFSGIGSQIKALKNIGIEHEIIATIEWDINAIIAYDIIHHGKQDLTKYQSRNMEELKEELSKYTLSGDGKTPLTEKAIKRLGRQQTTKLLNAIERNKNLGSITDVKGEDLADDIDLFTYSFPCQDLSRASSWHGNNSGINREANNRSGMLWQVERIMNERFRMNLSLPKFLLMENVSNILSDVHRNNFKIWEDALIGMGYINIIYTLNAKDFGSPQKRKRVYMLSVQCNNNKEKIEALNEYIENHRLDNERYLKTLNVTNKPIKDILRVEYDSHNKYKIEANEIQPNDTESRRKIYKENSLLYDGKEVIVESIQTITTKQDRHPNSGVINYDSNREGKSKFRYLTPRECFMLMGFDEGDFEKLIDNNFNVCKNKKFFTPSKLYKLAGNSIVVDVLEAIFRQVNDINDNIL